MTATSSATREVVTEHDQPAAASTASAGPSTVRLLCQLTGLVLVIRIFQTALMQFGWDVLVRGNPREVGTVHAHATFSSVHLLSLWGNWDTSWYLTVANHGYTDAASGVGARAWAYFPLYPALMHLLGTILGGPFVAGLVVSNVALVLALFFLYRLARLDLADRGAWRVVAVFLLLPVAFLTSAVLTESLFLMLAIGAFYFARRDRWLLACLFVCLLGTVRTLGVVIALPLLLEYLWARGFSWRRIRWNVLWFALTPVGLLAFSAYAWHRTGDPLVWQHVQFTTWGHPGGSPLTALKNGLLLHNPQHQMPAVVTVLYLVLIVGGLLLRRLRWTYGLFGLIAIVSTLSLGANFWGSMLRYLLPVFPVALLAGQVVRRRELELALFICLGTFQGALLLLWTATGTRTVF